MTYPIDIIWSEEDASYVARCPAFSGISGLGDTADEATAELQIALRLAIETHYAEGWPLPEPIQPIA